MILYQVYHIAHLHHAIIHRLRTFPNQRVLLLAGDAHWQLGSQTDLLSKLMQSNIFNEVICYDTATGMSNNGSTIEENIVKEYDKIFEKQNIDLSRMTAIISFADGEHTFGAYLAIKRFKYYMPEVLPDWYAKKRPVNCEKLLFKDEACMNAMAKYHVLSGMSDYCTPILFPGSKNVFASSKAVVFDFNDLSSISEDDKRKILNIYDVKLRLAENIKNCLFLFSSTWSIGDAYNSIPSISDQYEKADLVHLAHQIALDYYLPADNWNLMLKPHPSNALLASKALSYYNTKNILPHIFPVDLLPLFDELIERQFDLTFSTGTSASDKILKYQKQLIWISNGIYYTFHLHHKLSVVCELISKIDPCLSILFYSKKYKEGYVTHFNSQINQLIKHSYSNLPSALLCSDEFVSPRGDIVNIIDNFCADNSIVCQELLKGSTNAINIFLNTNNEFENYLTKYPELSKKAIKITINKLQLKREIIETLKPDHIFVFCKNDIVAKRISDFDFHRDLAFTGIRLSTKIELHEGCE